MAVKVCGITSAQQMSELCKLNVDYGGLIFYPRSPRYFVGKIQPDELKECAAQIRLTGVFVNEEPEYIKMMIDTYHLAAVQLCGSETVDECLALKKYADVFKVIHLDEEAMSVDLVSEWEHAVDYLLFDTKSAGFGGSGKKFDWNILSKSEIANPFFLSGGISADDAGVINSFQHPKFFGVDINSRFEISPGIKDMNKIKQFIHQLNRK